MSNLTNVELESRKAFWERQRQAEAIYSSVSGHDEASSTTNDCSRMYWLYTKINAFAWKVRNFTTFLFRKVFPKTIETALEAKIREIFIKIVIDDPKKQPKKKKKQSAQDRPHTIFLKLFSEEDYTKYPGSKKGLGPENERVFFQSLSTETLIQDIQRRSKIYRKYVKSNRISKERLKGLKNQEGKNLLILALEAEDEKLTSTILERCPSLLNVKEMDIETPLQHVTRLTSDVALRILLKVSCKRRIGFSRQDIDKAKNIAAINYDGPRQGLIDTQSNRFSISKTRRLQDILLRPKKTFKLEKFFVDDHENNHLHETIRKKDFKQMSALIARYPQLLTSNNIFGVSPLDIVINSSSLTIVEECLLSMRKAMKGPVLCKTLNEGLNKAFYDRKEEVCWMFLHHGADPFSVGYESNMSPRLTKWLWDFGWLAIADQNDEVEIKKTTDDKLIKMIILAFLMNKNQPNGNAMYRLNKMIVAGLLPTEIEDLWQKSFVLKYGSLESYYTAKKDFAHLMLSEEKSNLSKSLKLWYELYCEKDPLEERYASLLTQREGLRVELMERYQGEALSNIQEQTKTIDKPRIEERISGRIEIRIQIELKEALEKIMNERIEAELSQKEPEIQEEIDRRMETHRESVVGAMSATKADELLNGLLQVVTEDVHKNKRHEVELNISENIEKYERPRICQELLDKYQNEIDQSVEKNINNLVEMRFAKYIKDHLEEDLDKAFRQSIKEPLQELELLIAETLLGSSDSEDYSTEELFDQVCKTDNVFAQALMVFNGADFRALSTNHKDEVADIFFKWQQAFDMKIQSNQDAVLQAIKAKDSRSLWILMHRGIDVNSLTVMEKDFIENVCLEMQSEINEDLSSLESTLYLDNIGAVQFMCEKFPVEVVSVDKNLTAYRRIRRYISSKR